ncbi:MAG: hypothetical protein ACOCZK_04665 [Planctomycetota bacterium]
MRSRRRAGPAADAPPQPAPLPPRRDRGWTPPKLREHLQQDPAFRVASPDGLYWYDPFTGSQVDAAFDWLEDAFTWLMEHKPWRKRPQPMSRAEVAQIKWRRHIREQIPTERRLRLFLDNGYWLNPYTGRFVKNVKPPGSKLDDTVLDRMALALAQMDDQAAERIKELTILEGILDDADRKLKAQRSERAQAAAPPATGAPPAGTAATQPALSDDPRERLQQLHWIVASARDAQIETPAIYQSCRDRGVDLLLVDPHVLAHSENPPDLQTQLESAGGNHAQLVATLSTTLGPVCCLHLDGAGGVTVWAQNTADLLIAAPAGTTVLRRVQPGAEAPATTQLAPGETLLALAASPVAEADATCVRWTALLHHCCASEGLRAKALLADLHGVPALALCVRR